jgi:hypothetical protein
LLGKIIVLLKSLLVNVREFLEAFIHSVQFLDQLSGLIMTYQTHVSDGAYPVRLLVNILLKSFLWKHAEISNVAVRLVLLAHKKILFGKIALCAFLLF